ncbi:MAG: N-acetylneuraminate synthase [Thermodesulfobacteriota bacterium]
MLDVHNLSPDKVLIIAEAGCNHNGDLELAARLVDAAAEAGADAVKFQSFRPERMITAQAPKAEYQVRATGTAESQYQRLCRLMLSEADHRFLQERCRERRIVFCSSLFDHESADLLHRLEVPFFKIPSGEITNLPLLKHVAALGRPLLLSTGMSGLGEIEAALNTIAKEGGKDVILLHCVSSYPAAWAEANLRAIPALKAAFRLPVGFSDHSLGIELPLVAVALGAVVIEKHLTLDRSLEGGDHRASLEPGEFGLLVEKIRALGEALGDGVKRCMPSEVEIRRVARKSVVAARAIKKGETLTRENLILKRPGTGISPHRWEELLGRKAKRDLEADALLSWSDVSG